MQRNFHLDAAYSAALLFEGELPQGGSQLSQAESQHFCIGAHRVSENHSPVGPPILIKVMVVPAEHSRGASEGVPGLEGVRPFQDRVPIAPGAILLAPAKHLGLCVFPAFADAMEIMFMVFASPFPVKTRPTFGELEAPDGDQLLVAVVSSAVVLIWIIVIRAILEKTTGVIELTQKLIKKLLLSLHPADLPTAAEAEFETALAGPSQPPAAQTRIGDMTVLLELDHLVGKCPVAPGRFPGSAGTDPQQGHRGRVGIPVQNTAGSAAEPEGIVTRLEQQVFPVQQQIGASPFGADEPSPCFRKPTHAADRG